MSSRKKYIVCGAVVVLIVLGVFLFFQTLHMPTWMTYPYDVTIEKGEATINSYIGKKTEINIPKRILGARVVKIEEKAFDSLGEEAVILKMPEEIYAEKVYHQESQSYYRLVSNKEAWIIEYTGNEKKVVIPSEVWGYKVTAIGFGSFWSSSIEEVAIPETVTYIGADAFEGCKNLKQIELPSHLECIAVCAFKDTGIESIEIPPKVSEIELGAFMYSEIKQVVGLENVECLGNCAFRGTPFEESIKGDFVCIDDILYLYRGEEEEVVIPSSVKEIRGAFAIYESYSYPVRAKKVFIPESVTAISAYSFEGQENIEVYIPETVASLGTDISLGIIGSIFDMHPKEGCIIVTTSGSPAEAYAIEEEIPYRIITKEEMQQEMEAAISRQQEKNNEQ